MEGTPKGCAHKLLSVNKKVTHDLKFAKLKMKESQVTAVMQ